MAEAKQTGKKAPGRPAGDAGAARLALLTAARQEFAHRGYAAARMREVVNAAGASFPTLYHHFGSKAGLYAAVAEQVNDEVLGALGAAAEGHDSVSGRLDAILDATVVLQATEPTLADFVVGAPVDYARHPELEIAAPQMRRLREFVMTVVAGALPDGISEADAAHTMIVLIYGLSRIAATATPAEYRDAANAARRMARATL